MKRTNKYITFGTGNDDYKIIKQIGQGSFGKIYSAVNVQNGEIFHGGATDVFNSFIAFYPEEKITIIVLINQPQNEKYAATIARSVHKTVFEKEEE